MLHDFFKRVDDLLFEIGRAGTDGNHVLPLLLRELVIGEAYPSAEPVLTVSLGLDVDDLPQQSVRDAPMTFRIINSDGRGFCVEADDDSDPLAQMFVREADGVSDEESKM